jgi:protein TIF31
MGKVCEYFHLDENIPFVDGEGKTHLMGGGIEVKGILGSDKRMYLLDLLRLSPRDLNYGDMDLH